MAVYLIKEGSTSKGKYLSPEDTYRPEGFSYYIKKDGSVSIYLDSEIYEEFPDIKSARDVGWDFDKLPYDPKVIKVSRFKVNPISVGKEYQSKKTGNKVKLVSVDGPFNNRVAHLTPVSKEGIRLSNGSFVKQGETFSMKVAALVQQMLSGRITRTDLNLNK